MRKRVPRSVLAALRSVPLFSNCTNRQLRTLAGLGTSVAIEEGRELTVAGAPGAGVVRGHLWKSKLSGRRPQAR